MPEVLSFDAADTRFGLRTLLPAYDEDGEVTLLEPGTHAASDIDLDAGSYVVDGDLAIDGDLTGTEEGGFLVVRGDLQVTNLLAGGPIIHVSGAVHARHAIHTDYNHGLLVVGGDVRARVIAAEHAFTIGGTLDCPITIDFGGLRVSTPGFVPTLTRQQATRECRDHFIPDVLNAQGYVNGASLARVLASGRSPLLR